MFKHAYFESLMDCLLTGTCSVWKTAKEVTPKLSEIRNRCWKFSISGRKEILATLSCVGEQKRAALMMRKLVVFPLHFKVSTCFIFSVSIRPLTTMKLYCTANKYVLFLSVP